MCRLFGMTAGPNEIGATFWLLRAPESLLEQSYGQPDGAGIGTFTADGIPEVERHPVAAFEAGGFIREAREERSRTFVAHLRFGSTGPASPENTHPFEQRGRLFAHNGVIGGLDQLEARLGEHRGLVHGDTDSERLFALVTREVEAQGGDVGAGIEAAVQWVAANLPVYALNLVLTTADELWALRYPATHELWMLQRFAGGSGEPTPLDAQGHAGTVHVSSTDLLEVPVVVVASERMDDDPAWRLLPPGALLHVDARLRVSVRTVLDAPPAHPLSIVDLDERASRSQLALRG